MNFKKSAYSFGGILLSLCLFFSCTIGMGNALDLTAPKLTVTSHMNGAKVGLEIDLSGTCTDNIGVTKVTIQSVDTGVYFDNAIISGTSWTTHLSLSKEYEGDRTFLITAVDAAENITTASYAILVLSIDQTGPNDVDWYIDRGNAIRTDIVDLETLKAKNLYFSENKDIPQNEQFTVYGSLYDAMSINKATLSLCTVNGKLLIEKTYSSNPDDTEEYIGADKSIFSPEFTFEHNDLKDLIDDDGTTLESGIHYLWLKCYLEDEHGNNFSRNIGYMVWWPESDLPGIYQKEMNLEKNTLSVLIDASVPLDIFDDDGLDEIYYALKTDTVYGDIPGTSLAEKCQAVINNTEGIRDSLLIIDTEKNEVGDSATGLSVSKKRDNPVQIKTPSTPATMYLIACAKDIHGKWNCRIIYTTIADDSSPMLFIDSPRNNEKPQMNAGTNTFTINGYSLGKNESLGLKLVYISGNDTNEVKKNTATKILNGELAVDPAKGQILETLTLNPYVLDDDTKLKKQTFTKTFDIINDLSKYNGDKETSYFFMFRLQGTSSVVDQIYQLNKDVALPTITVAEPNNMQAVDYTKGGLTIKFKAEKDSGLAITEQKVSYGQTSWTLGNGLTKDGEYFVKSLTKAELTEIYKKTPQPQFDIWVKDALGYEATEQRTVVLTTLPSLTEVTSENPNGTYITDNVLTFQAKFSDAVRVRNTTSTKKPRLKIKYSAGDTTERYAEYSSGSGTTTLVFTYTVPANAVSNGISIATLDSNNTIIDLNGCEIVSVSGGDGDAYITVPSGKNLNGKTFALDGVAPTIKALNLGCDLASSDKNADGNFYVKADNKLTVTVELTEKIFISGSPSLQMKVKNAAGAKTNITFDFKEINSAGTILTFEHKVNSSTPNGTVCITKASCFNPDNLNLISDVNGNGLVLSSASETDSNILVDTVKPSSVTVNLTSTKAPKTVNGIPTYTVQPSFTVTGAEAGNKVEYTLDNGVTWSTYTSEVKITSSGNKKIIARQTDKAGNVSDLPAYKEIVVDCDFPSIVDFTITSPDGNYKKGSKVNFALSFSDKVIAVADSSTVTFTSIDGTVTKTANVIATAAAGQNTVYYEYEVEEGLNLQGIKLKSVSYTGFKDSKDVVATSTYAKDETRSGIILDGIAPALSSVAPAMTGGANGFNGTASGINSSTDNSSFTITLNFAENVYKETGKIILQRKGDWAIPAVMDSTEFLAVYNKVKALDKKNGTTTAQTLMKTDANGQEIFDARTGIAVGPYRKITHGLRLSNGKYVPDSNTKYVLAYDLDLYSGSATLSTGKLYTADTSTYETFTVSVADIRSVLESVDYHRHSIDVAGGNVKIYKADGTTEVDYEAGEGGQIVKITFDDSADPVEDGREWELVIPGTAFRDNAENFYKGMNLETTSDKYSVWSNNVAQPVVRVDRYTHGWGAKEPKADGTFTTITVNNGKYNKTSIKANSAAIIAPTGYARARIDCETPDVTFKYSKIYADGTVYTDTVPTGVSYNNTTAAGVVTTKKDETDNHKNARNLIADITKANLEKKGATAYTKNSDIIIGDGEYTTARKDYITAYATKTGFEDSINGYEGIFKTIVYVSNSTDYNINIEGGTAAGGQPSVSGFPLRDATAADEPYGAGRYSKNCYCKGGESGKSQIFVSYEIISDEWAILLCRGNHSKDYPSNSYGGSAYVTSQNYWNE